MFAQIILFEDEIKTIKLYRKKIINTFIMRYCDG